MSKAINYYFHGSQTYIKDKVLEPRPSNILNKEKAVFATNKKWIAVFMMAGENDIGFGFYNNIPYIEEEYPGAFDQLKIGGYIYYMDSSQFKSDKRLGMPGHEFISDKKVKILKTIKIKNAYNYLKRQKDLRFVTFDIKMKAINQYYNNK